ncbi:MAG: riboflavin synthase, partial [Nitrospirota bacterium]|nr:riboflavin synthase [Nitrospirota bacterium]
SLTVASTSGAEFSVMLIPHTLGETTLGSRAKGAAVNLEADIIGKYVEKLTGHFGKRPEASGLSEEMLAQYGFLK